MGDLHVYITIYLEDKKKRCCLKPDLIILINEFIPHPNPGLPNISRGREISPDEEISLRQANYVW